MGRYLVVLSDGCMPGARLGCLVGQSRRHDGVGQEVAALQVVSGFMQPVGLRLDMSDLSSLSKVSFCVYVTS